MNRQNWAVVLAGLLLGCSVGAAASRSTPPGPDATFDAKGAAAYLDARAEWWTAWPNAQRDHGTFCISCHTTLPYALARPELSATLGEGQPSPTESKILNNLLTRAR